MTPQTGSRVKAGTIEGPLVGISGAYGYILTYRSTGEPVSLFPILLKDLEVIDPANQFEA